MVRVIPRVQPVEKGGRLTRFAWKLRALGESMSLTKRRLTSARDYQTAWASITRQSYDQPRDVVNKYDNTN